MKPAKSLAQYLDLLSQETAQPAATYQALGGLLARRHTPEVRRLLRAPELRRGLVSARRALPETVPAVRLLLATSRRQVQQRLSLTRSITPPIANMIVQTVSGWPDEWRNAAFEAMLGRPDLCWKVPSRLQGRQGNLSPNLRQVVFRLAMTTSAAEELPLVVRTAVAQILAGFNMRWILVQWPEEEFYAEIPVPVVAGALETLAGYAEESLEDYLKSIGAHLHHLNPDRAR